MLAAVNRLGWPPANGGLAQALVAVRKNLDLVWVWFYKERAPMAGKFFSKKFLLLLPEYIISLASCSVNALLAGTRNPRLDKAVCARVSYLWFAWKNF
jgi:hypothetical protein